MTRAHDPAEPDQTAAVELMRLATGYRVSQVLYVAARLGLADLVANGPRSAEELARHTGAHASSLARLLRTLAAFGILHEDDDGRYELTPLGTLLRADHPRSLRDAVLMFGSGDFWQTWGDLLQCIQTGESANQRRIGVPNVFAYYAQHPELSAMMNAGFAATGRMRADALLGAFDFSASSTLVDVGGGRGHVLAAILRAYPTLRGVLMDQPHVVAEAGPLLAQAGVANRCTMVAGDMFTEIPSAGDTYLLIGILHDWDDAQALSVLKNCHRALSPGARLLICEPMLPARVGTSPAAQEQTISDLNMLVRTGGQERTEAEYQALLDAAGLALVRMIPTRTAYSVIECNLR